MDGARFNDLDDVAHVPVPDVDKHLARHQSVAFKQEFQLAELTELVEKARCITFIAKRTLQSRCQQFS